MPAPIVLFTYNRPTHTRRTLEALAASDLADQSTLYIYADGPKQDALDADVEGIANVRTVIRERQWCKEVNIVESEQNRGLADSIVGGVTEVVNRHGRVIVLEDDILVRRGFLTYLNAALDMYADDPRVMHISAMIFGTPRGVRSGTAFLRILSCNGWATWNRAWQHYEHDPIELIRRLECQGISPDQFNIEGSAHFYKQLLANRDGTMYTWAVRWYASWLTAGGYALFPHRSLLSNIGHDGSGVHGVAEFYNGETVELQEVRRQPVEENIELRREVDRIWRRGRQLDQRAPRAARRWLGRAKKALNGALRKLVRATVNRAYPEFAGLDVSAAKQCGLLSSAYNCSVSESARLIPPYHLNGSTVGDYTYIMPNSWISMAKIGKFCSIGPRFCCGGGIHPVDGISTAPMFYSPKKQNGMTLSPHDKCVERKPVTIGNDVFIGMNVTVLDGVTIGDGAVVGAGCVVSKDVPPYAIVAGNPMRILRYRFDEDTIEKLLKIRWWDWPKDRLPEVERYFFDPKGFAERFADTDGGDTHATGEKAP